MKKYLIVVPTFIIIVGVYLLFFNNSNVHNDYNRNNTDVYANESISEAAGENAQENVLSESFDTENDDELDTAVRTTTFIESIHPDLPPMQFDIVEDSYISYFSENVVDFITIIIRWYETGELIQEINEIETLTGAIEKIHTIGVPGEYFIIEDINFDGYKDIRFPLAISGQVHVFHYCWTFDSGTNKFEFRHELFMPNMQVDTDNQVITTGERGSGFFTITHYMFINDVLTPTLQERLGEPGRERGGSYDVTYKMVDGEWIEIERVPNIG